MASLPSLFNRPVTRLMLEEKNLGEGVDLGRYNLTEARSGLAPHSHQDAMEICFLVKGNQTYRVHHRDYKLRGGDVFITFPNERHCTGNHPQEKGILYWMILKIPGKKDSRLGLSPIATNSLYEKLLNIKSRFFRGSLEMKQLLDEVVLTCEQNYVILEKNLIQPILTPLQKIYTYNRIISFLLQVIEQSPPTPRRQIDQPDTRMNRVTAFIEQNLSEPLSVPLLAKQAQLSVPRFKARFQKSIGMPPAQYVLRAKIEDAKIRLSENQRSITDIAFDLGFPTSQYFATVFKRFTGQRPVEFRRISI
jgi:AraC-like DNA-binding protein